MIRANRATHIAPDTAATYADVANEMLLAGSSTPRRDSPSLGSIITRLQPAQTAIPPYVWLQKFGGGAAPAEAAYRSGGFLGINSSPLLDRKSTRLNSSH